jgi:hypothetical protein
MLITKSVGSLIRRHKKPSDSPESSSSEWRKTFVSAKIKPEDEIRRAAANVVHLVQGHYPQVKAEVDLETVEIGEDAYVWITLNTPDLLDEVRTVACNFAADFWESEDIFIVPRMRLDLPSNDAPVAHAE